MSVLCLARHQWQTHTVQGGPMAMLLHERCQRCGAESYHWTNCGWWRRLRRRRPGN